MACCKRFTELIIFLRASYFGLLQNDTKTSGRDWNISHIVMLNILRFRSKYRILTYDHHREFKSFLDALAKNLIRKIRKTHIALHSFGTLYDGTNEQSNLSKSNTIGDKPACRGNSTWNNLPLLRRKIFWLMKLKPLRRHNDCSSREEGKYRLKLVHKEAKRYKLVIDLCKPLIWCCGNSNSVKLNMHENQSFPNRRK